MSDTAQPGPMEQWMQTHVSIARGGHGQQFECIDAYAATAFAREQDAERDRLIEQNAALLAALKWAVATIDRADPQRRSQMRRSG